MLTQDRVKELFHYTRDGMLLRKFGSRQKNVGTALGSIQKDGYRSCSVDGKSYGVHRIVFLWHHGYFADIIDHINRKPYDNRIENLRECTAKQNSCNKAGFKTKRTKRGGSKYKGVSRAGRKRRFAAKIRGLHIGTFSSPEEAAFEYNIEAKKLYGEFAYLNVLPRDYVHITER